MGIDMSHMSLLDGDVVLVSVMVAQSPIYVRMCGCMAVDGMSWVYEWRYQ